MAVICTDEDTVSIENLEKDWFSAKDAVNRVNKTFKKKGIKGPPDSDVREWRELYNKYSHSSYRNFPTIIALSSGNKIIGAMFDPRQEVQYKEELTNRSKLASIFSQYVNSIELILAKGLP